MKTELELFIEQNKDWKEKIQQEPYNIKVKEDYNYYMLKYNQIAESTDWSLKIVKECRGIVLRKSDLKIVCYGFDRFYNAGSPYASSIDLDNSKVIEKVDGSLLKFWVDNDELRISTNGAIDAFKTQISSMIYGVGQGTFGDKAIELLDKYNININELKDLLIRTNSCAMFEFVSSENQVVIEYKIPKLYYLGSRNLITKEEFIDDTLQNIFDKPNVYNVKLDIFSIKELVDTLNDMEGVVVVDSNYNRLKIKNINYLIQQRAIDKITDKDIIKIVLENEVDEYLATIPFISFKNRLLKVKSAIDDIFDFVELTVSVAKKNMTKKEFAETFKNHLYRSILFLAYDNDNYREKIKITTMKKILELEYVI